MKMTMFIRCSAKKRTIRNWIVAVRGAIYVWNEYGFKSIKLQGYHRIGASAKIQQQQRNRWSFNLIHFICVCSEIIV